MTSAFYPPDFETPLPLEEYLAGVPAHALERGMFFQSIVNEVRARGGELKSGPYIALKNYPMRDFLTLLSEGAAVLYPDLPLREALRRLGQRAYLTLIESSLTARVIFGAVGLDVASAFRLISRVYSLVSNISKVQLLEVDDNHAILALRNAWVFPSSYQVGVFEGGLVAFGRKGEVLVKSHSLCDVDFQITWR